MAESCIGVGAILHDVPRLCLSRGVARDLGRGLGYARLVEVGTVLEGCQGVSDRRHDGG